MKVLIFGPAGAGKTSLMRTVTYGENFDAVLNLLPTRGVARENYRFRGLLDINVWDAGGQSRYTEQYFTDQQRSRIFSDVEVGIFMCDATEINAEVARLFQKYVQAILEFSPRLRSVYVFINKMDLPGTDLVHVQNFFSAYLDDTVKGLCEFLPVSVKEGTAQESLINILDQFAEEFGQDYKSQIQVDLDALKGPDTEEILLFNRPDGLLLASTFSEAIQLKYLTFEIGPLESVVYSIVNTINQMKKQEIRSVTLDHSIFRTPEAYIVAKNPTQKSSVIVISNSKDPQSVAKILEIFSEQNAPYKKLQEDLETNANIKRVGALD